MLVSVFSSRRTRGRFISLFATAALSVGVMGLGAAPVSAANGCTLTGAASGTVGVAQNLTFAGCLGATTLTATNPTTNYGLTSSISVDASGAGSHSWTPQNSGVANLSLNASNDNGGILASVNITGGGSTVCSTMTLAAAPVLSPNISAGLVATVADAYGDNSPAGTVTFTDSNKNVLGTASLNPTRDIDGAKSLAKINWAPTALGPITITATYIANSTCATASATKTFTVGLQTQTAEYSAPASGPVNKGRTLKLEAASEHGTNAGQNITWVITSSKKKCSLEFPSSGDVKLKIKKKGVCAVTGTAPGVANEWSPYSISLRYHAK
ncbi:MAG: hypothetical protein F2763_04590 [Actinobacteria bacterium]|uniref:Unannotated protein n=1 Tax=freshwater metagenome TaxID=449393 RepID=A0A6J7AED7_9ZZZZ|nr:hypothetical protein [Actinomycetota bacterium]